MESRINQQNKPLIVYLPVLEPSLYNQLSWKDNVHQNEFISVHLKKKDKVQIQVTSKRNVKVRIILEELSHDFMDNFGEKMEFHKDNNLISCDVIKFGGGHLYTETPQVDLMLGDTIKNEVDRGNGCTINYVGDLQETNGNTQKEDPVLSGSSENVNKGGGCTCTAYNAGNLQQTNGSTHDEDHVISGSCEFVVNRSDCCTVKFAGDLQETIGNTQKEDPVLSDSSENVVNKGDGCAAYNAGNLQQINGSTHDQNQMLSNSFKFVANRSDWCTVSFAGDLQETNGCAQKEDQVLSNSFENVANRSDGYTSNYNRDLNDTNGITRQGDSVLSDHSYCYSIKFDEDKVDGCTDIFVADLQETHDNSSNSQSFIENDEKDILETNGLIPNLLRNIDCSGGEGKGDLSHISHSKSALLRKRSSNISYTKSLECQICGKKFSYFKCFQAHIKSHTRRKESKGNKGNKSTRNRFVRNMKLEGHQAKPRHSTGENGFENKEKPKKIPKNSKNPKIKMDEPENSKQKISKISKPREKKDDGFFHCNLCKKKFRQRHSLKKHINSHRGTYLFKCRFCFQTYNLKSDLDCHMKQHTCKCSICGLDFKQDYLKQHMKVHSNDRPHKCEFCEKGFTLKDSLRRHRLIHTEVKSHSCKICGKSFHEQVQLKYHMDIHFEGSKIICHICGKSIKQPYLQEHTRAVHGKEKPFKCDKCGMNFTSKVRLMKHIENHTRLIICEICGKSYPSTTMLKYHMVMHTGATPYECKHCDKKFKWRGMYIKHMDVHLGKDKKYLCDVCGKHFYEKILYNNHLNTHSGNKPFHCTLCPKTYPTYSGIQQHYKFIHAVKSMKNIKTYEAEATDSKI